MPIITPETLAILRKHDTPTICNALEHVMGGRTAEGFTKTPVVCADASLPPTRPLQMVPANANVQPVRRKPSEELSVEPEDEFTEQIREAAIEIV